MKTLEGGLSYNVAVTVVNTSHKGDTPVAATLITRMSAMMDNGFLLEPGVEQNYNFAPLAQHTFYFPIFVPETLINKAGKIQAGIFTPGLILLGRGSLDIQVVAPPAAYIGPVIWGAPYTRSGYGGGIVFRNAMVSVNIPVPAGQQWLIFIGGSGIDADPDSGAGFGKEVEFTTTGGLQTVSIPEIELIPWVYGYTVGVTIRPKDKPDYATVQDPNVLVI